MKRLLILPLLLLPLLILSCAPPPVWVGNERPVAAPATMAKPCHEVSRSRCNVDACGPGADAVTLQCSDGVIRRCVLNTTCDTR